MPDNKLQNQGLLQMRGVDPDTWRRFRVYAVSNRMSMAKALKHLLDLANVPPPPSIP